MNVSKTEMPMAQLYPLMQAGFEQGLSVTLGITGNSMFPMLRHKRDSVILVAYDGSPLKRGDLPLYRRRSGQFVLHRVVAVTPTAYTMCGDNQTEWEHGIPPENILALVTGFIRKGRYIPCTSRGYRLYVAVWRWIRPLRRVAAGCITLCRRGKRWLARHIKPIKRS